MEDESVPPTSAVSGHHAHDRKEMGDLPHLGIWPEAFYAVCCDHE